MSSIIMRGVFMQIFAQRLRALREAASLSREKAANALQITSRTYQRYENDEREPTAPTIVALADFFGVSADYLLGRSDER